MQGAEPYVSAKILGGVGAALRSYPGLNIGLEQLLGDVGLDPEVVRTAEVLPLNPIAALFENAAERTGDACFGLHLARFLPPGASGILGFMLSNAPDLRTFSFCLARFIKLRIDALEIAFTEENGDARLTWSFGPALVVPHKQLTELLLTMFMDRVRYFLDDTWRPAKIEFMYQEPNAAGEYEAKFGRNLVFDAPATRITAPSSSLLRSGAMANPELFRTLRRIAEEEVAKLTPAQDIVDRIGKYVLDNVGLGGVELGAAASAVKLSTRQLQSELQRRGTTFEAEVAVVRQRMAMRYLRDTALPMTEIALLLGYSELSAFTRACKAWFQVPPREKRALLRAGSKE